MIKKTKGCYSIKAEPFVSTIFDDCSCIITISDGSMTTTIALSKQEAINWCSDTINMMNKEN